MPSSSQDSKPPHISVESCDFHNPSQRITSPRSIEACNRLGIDPKELYYIDFAKKLGAKIGDSIFFVADAKLEKVQKIAGLIRIELGKRLDLLEKDTYRFCFIVDFPMY